MGKRVAIFLIALLTLGLAILGYFLHQERENLLTDPYKAVPPGACFVIETAGLQNFLNSLSAGNGLPEDISKIDRFDRFNASVKFLSEKLKNDEIKNIIKNRVTIISFYPDIKGKLRALLSVTVPQGTNLSDVAAIMNTNHKGNAFLELPFSIGSKRDTVFVTVRSGLLLCSPSRGLLERSVAQIRMENDIRNEAGFQKLLMVSGSNEDKIFVIFPNLATLIEPSLADGFKYISGKISNLAGSAVCDIYFNDDGIVLSGYTESTDPTESIYKYKSVTPGSFHTFRILPASTVLFESLILPEAARNNAPDTIVPEQTGKLALRISEYIGEEVTRAYIDTRGSPARNNTLIIYELKNRVQAEQIFLEELGKDDNENKLLFFEPDEQVRIPVYKTHFNGLASLLVPGFSGKTDDSYVSFYENFMITGSSFVTISRFLYDNLLNKTLANDLVYRDFENTLPSRSVYFFYCVPGRITNYLTQYLNDSINDFLKSNLGSINKIQAAGYQFIPSNDMIYNSISIKFQEEAREESTAEWETLLDTTAAIKPFFFTNHLNRSKEIFIQDLKNNVYLINSAGLIIWKVPLDERINGTVYMIDFYRNGKYQLLFAGRNYMHLLDRNGNYVERYPVKLRSPATNSLALFDYDNNRDYRLLIAGEDRLIYAYDKNGSIIKGWKPFKTPQIVNSEIYYFRVSGKDYLVVSDESSVYFFDRRGNIRLKLKEPVIRAKGSAIRLIQGAEASVVCTSPDGTIQQIYFNGNVKKHTLKKKFTGNHYFDVFDIDGDGPGEYIFIDEGKIYLYDSNNEEVFIREFGAVELVGPLNFIFSSSDRKIGIFDNTSKLIYLIDKNGEIMNGFPLRGVSIFSIGKLSDKGGWHLLVGGWDGFLYNYRIDTE